MECPAAKIALAAAHYGIDRPYSYLVPRALQDTLRPGMRVLVPFGQGNRPTDGLVLALDREEAGPKMKTILAQLDESPVLDQEGLRLALWMREQYFCTVYEAARVTLPAGLWFSIRDLWKLCPGVDREAAYAAAGTSSSARQVVDILFAQGGSVEEGVLRGAMGTRSPTAALKLLRDKGVVALEVSADRGVGDKTEQVAVLAMPGEEALSAMARRRAAAPLQYAVTELLASVGRASVKDLCYFTGASRATVKALAKRGVLRLEEREVLRSPLPETAPVGEDTPLTPEQEEAARGLKALMDKGEAAAALLYGVTGSGKTRVYLSLIQAALDAGRSAILMVPEIALTPQLLYFFSARFSGRTAVLHSSLTAGERYDEWKRIHRGEARLVIGTRSAVFAPAADLGLIILDEEQEGSYKSENSPRYHAREVAKYRCAKGKALLVMGSATPSVETMYAALQGQYHLFTLPHRYNRRPLPPVEIIDMRQELRQGNGGVISAPLRQALADNLARGEQSILFLNRRGTSRLVTCGECGEVPSCPRCSVHLTYHAANGRLMCHYCGYSQPFTSTCPACGGLMALVGAGTQRIQAELQELFPGTEVMRVDTDTVSATHSHEALFSRFIRQKIPILVGTQMVAKGLNFENVTLVGVVAADLSLYVDDYRAGERTFSLLTQVVGRAGRGEKGGRAMIQTWSPDHDVITCAARQDYDAFYRQEIALRQLRGCPPFQDLFVLTAAGEDETAVLRALVKLRRALEGAVGEEPYRPLAGQLLGPAPAAVAKVNNRYRYRLVLSGHNRRPLRELIAHLLRAARQDRENRGVTLWADCNPMD